MYTFLAKMNGNRIIAFLGIFTAVIFFQIYPGYAQQTLQGVTEVNTIYPSEWGVGHPAGLAYSVNLNQFFLLEKDDTTQPTIVTLTPYEELVHRVNLDSTIADAINITFDDTANRLLLFNQALTELIQIQVGSNGVLDLATKTHISIAHLGLTSARGMAIDSKGKFLFILDGAASQIVRVKLETSLEQVKFNKFDLAPALDLLAARGIALNPQNRHLYIVHPGKQILYELTQSGQPITQYDLASLQLIAPRAAIYASSPDLTDSSDVVHLFIADSQVAVSQAADAQESELSLLYKLYLSFIAADSPTDVATSAGQQAVYGKIVEVALGAATTEVSAASPNLTTLTLVQTINTAAFSPPSPDPSGITYIPATDTLLISDAEVDEMPPYFTGKNLFGFTRLGVLSYTKTTTAYSNEPAGAAYNPNNGHLFFSSDDQKRVFEVNPGTDGVLNTSDDSVTSFSTSAFSSMDPEGLDYDAVSGDLFIGDGVNNEIYRVDPGADGIFNGVPNDSVTSFDTAGIGIRVPDGVDYVPTTGNLILISNNDTRLYEVSTAGVLVQTFDISAANAIRLGGVQMAPNSTNPTVMSFYVADRRVDNDADPNENDGKIYEFALPPGVNNPPVANNDSANTTQATAVTINVATNDTDPDGNLVPASATIICATCTIPANGSLVNHGNGSFTYTPNAGFTGANSFVYQICDTQNACDTASVAITVNPANDPPVANDNSAGTAEDTAVNINVAANDTDPDGNLVHASANTSCATCVAPANGSLVNNSNGSFTYTPNQNFNGTDSFVYQICDTQNACDTASVAITVNPVDDPPVANDDSASTTKDTAVNINVVANDTDPDGNLVHASANTTCATGCTNPANGPLVNNGNGSFTYTPNAGFTGANSFVYQICDTQSACDTASVAITVNSSSVTSFRLSLASSGTAGAVDARDEDILEFNGTSFAMIFDGSDVGVGGVDTDAFYFLDANTILLSFDNSVTIGALGTVADSDIVQFDATSLGATTAGSFSLYFDGSVVGLDTSNEDIDAIDLLTDGRLLLSTRANSVVPGVSGADEDLLAFTPTMPGNFSSGTWAMYFDGSDVGLSTTSDEDVDGASVATNGDIYLTTLGNFAVTNVSGADEDIFICTPTALGSTTACTYASTLFFDGSAWGLAANDLDAIDLIEGGQQAGAVSSLALQTVEQPDVVDDANTEPVEETAEVDELVQDQQIFLPLVRQ